MDINCSLKSPCSRDRVCNLDSSKCVPSFSKSGGIIHTRIKDRKFEGSHREIQKQVISLFSELKKIAELHKKYKSRNLLYYLLKYPHPLTAL